MLAGLGQKGVARVPEALAEVQASRALGDQGPVPRPPAPSGLPERGVEGKDGGPGVADRPGPLGLEQPHQVQEVLRRVGGAGGEPSRQPVQLGDQAVALAGVGGRLSLPGEGEPAQHARHGADVEGRACHHQRHRGCGVPVQILGLAEDRRSDGAADMRVQERRRVVGVALGGDRLSSRGGVLATERGHEPPVVGDPLGTLLVAHSAREGDCLVDLSGADVQRGCAIQQVRHGGVVGIAGVGQVAPRDQPLPGTAKGLDPVLDGLEPAAHEGEQEAGLRGVGRVSAGLPERHDPPHGPVPGGSVGEHRHRSEGAVAGRAEQRTVRAVVDPYPQRLQAQPGHRREVADEVRRRQDRVDQLGRRQHGRDRSTPVGSGRRPRRSSSQRYR